MAEIRGEAPALLCQLKAIPGPSMKYNNYSKANKNLILWAGNVARRVLDVVGTTSGFLILFPIFLVIAVLIKRKSSGNIFFRQIRIGRYGASFVLYKFRTMANLRDRFGKLLPDGERMTDIGRWLRRWSLDELPELFNVLKGEMSLVGPRPLLPQYHEVKPGMTGWAQINGRNAITWEEKFALDVWYVDHRSFLLDLKIILRTISAVIRREGISAKGEATMPEFMGTSTQEEKS
jgi:sugar transferase EpsL